MCIASNEQLGQKTLDFAMQQDASRPPSHPTRALIELICTSRLPFSIVTDPSFSYFVEAVKKHPEWKVPHRTTLSTNELDKLYGDVTAELKRNLDKCKYLTLTTDGTTSPDGTSYWSVTASALDEEFNLHTAILACVPAHANHSGKNLADIVKSVLQSIGIEEMKVVAVVTDEGGGAPCIAQHFPNATAMFCSAHLLQTSIRHAFDATYNKFPLIESVFLIAKYVTNKYHSSNIHKAEIDVLQCALSDSVTSLLKDVVTRWLSKWNTLTSMKNNEEAIKVWIDQTLLGDPALSSYNPAVFWPLLHELHAILKPFADITKDFSTELKPSLHLPVDRVLYLHEQLNYMKLQLPNKMVNDHVRSALSFLLSELDKEITLKFENWDPLELAAYALNPDNRKPATLAEETMLESGYNSIAQLLQSPLLGSINPNRPTPAVALSGPPPLSSVWNRDEQKRMTREFQVASEDELRTYKEQKHASTTETLGEFWARLKTSCPRLWSLALLVFSIPCSQTASEREFSLLRLLCTRLRGRLLPETVNKLLCSSAFLSRRNQAREAKEHKPLTAEQQEAYKARVISLLETNKKRKRDQAIQIESASKLAELDLESVLSNLRLPIFLNLDDIELPTTASRNEVMAQLGDGETADDEDFDPELFIPRKRSKRADDDIPLPRQSSGVCNLTRALYDNDTIEGTLEGPENFQVKPKQVFGKWLDHIQLSAASTDLHVDGTTFLRSKFEFTLSSKGKKKFKGRGSLLSEIGELIQIV